MLDIKSNSESLIFFAGGGGEGHPVVNIYLVKSIYNILVSNIASMDIFVGGCNVLTVI